MIIFAEAFLGVAIYAAMSKNFPCNSALDSLHMVPKPAIAVLAGSFGDNFRCVNRFLSRYSHKPHLLVIHLSNEVCRRNSNCTNYDIHPNRSVASLNRAIHRGRGHRRFIRKAIFISRKVKANDNSHILVSLGLEDSFTNKAWQKLYEKVSPHIPHFIRNPVNFNLHAMPNDELHGLYFQKGAIHNLDGIGIQGVGAYSPTITVSHTKKWLRRRKDSYANFLWRGEWQGLHGQQTFIPPRKRSYRFDKSDILVVNKLLRRQL